jgi:sugar lactone lactonase YvrE
MRIASAIVWTTRICCCLLLARGTAYAQIITTVAGGGPPVGAAASMVLEGVSAVATDSVGNVLFASGEQVLRLDRATSVVTHVAGNGQHGAATANGGPATAAGFPGIYGLAVSTTGNVYIADGRQVRRVEGDSGAIDALAGSGATSFGGDGGAATAAGLSAYDVVLDSSRNLYIADARNHRIRRVDAATGIITTVAGTGTAGFSGDGGQATAARLNEPYGLCLDPSGRLLIADRGNHRVRRVNLVSGVITTLAGSSNVGFAGDGGAATAARLNSPRDVAVSATGDVYIADTSNDRVRRVLSATGVISTLAGDGGSDDGDGGLASAAGLSEPRGLAFDASGGLLIADRGHQRLRRVDLATAQIATLVGGAVDDGLPAAAARMDVVALAVAASGDLYVASLTTVRRVSVATGRISTVAGDPERSCTDTIGDGGLAVNAKLCVVRGLARVAAGTGIITTVAGNGTYGSTADGVLATSAAMYPDAIRFSPAGDLHISEGMNFRVRRVDHLTGILSTVAGSGIEGFGGDGGLATAAQIGLTDDIAFDAAGNLFIADTGNYRVRKVSAATHVITTIAGNGSYGSTADGSPAVGGALGFVYAIAVDGAGNVLVGDDFRVRRISASTGLLSTVAGTGVFGFSGDGYVATAATMTTPSALAVRGSDLFIADYENRRVRRAGTSGVGPLTWIAPAVGGSRAVRIGQTFVAPWQATSSAAWLAATPASGSGSAQVTLTAEPNPLDTVRTANVTLGGQTVRVTQLPDLPAAWIDRSRLTFAAVKSGAALTAATGAQRVRFSQSGALAVAWTASSSSPWLRVTPASGTGAADLSVSVTYSAGLPGTGTVTGSITITPAGSTPVPPVTVDLIVRQAAAVAPPFGSVDTPADGAAGVVGAVPFTGWALDDIGVSGVSICRAAVAGEAPGVDARCGNTARVYVGDAIFIDGARPDVEAAFAGYPMGTRAGWGFMVLTNMLPDTSLHTATGGNGTFAFTLYARDADLHTTVLGTRTITCANAGSTLPFGTIDTPTQGGTVSGASYTSFGWALTPQPKSIEVGGASVEVFIDGASRGPASYGYARADIQALFPGYANTDSAVGFHTFDTTVLGAGMHTMSWTVCDSQGACTNIGSRYFWASNGGVNDASRIGATASAPVARTDHDAAVPLMSAAVDALPADAWPIDGRRGWSVDTPMAPLDITAGARTMVTVDELDRVELWLPPANGERVRGFLRAHGRLRDLPAGASLDALTGIFTWAPGAGFIGRYDLVFVRSVNGRPIGRRDVRVMIRPRRGARPAASR